MKRKIIKILKERGETNITDFLDLMPEIKGDYQMCMPTLDGLNKNVLWLHGVSEKFIKAFNELMLDEKLIEWQPVDILSYMWSHSPIYNLPIADKKMFKTQKECWLPISLKLIQTIK